LWRHLLHLLLLHLLLLHLLLLHLLLLHLLLLHLLLLHLLLLHLLLLHLLLHLRRLRHLSLTRLVEDVRKATSLLLRCNLARRVELGEAFGRCRCLCHRWCSIKAVEEVHRCCRWRGPRFWFLRLGARLPPSIVVAPPVVTTILVASLGTAAIVMTPIIIAITASTAVVSPAVILFIFPAIQERLWITALCKQLGWAELVPRHPILSLVLGPDPVANLFFAIALPRLLKILWKSVKVVVVSNAVANFF